MPPAPSGLMISYGPNREGCAAGIVDGSRAKRYPPPQKPSTWPVRHARARRAVDATGPLAFEPNDSPQRVRTPGPFDRQLHIQRGGRADQGGKSADDSRDRDMVQRASVIFAALHDGRQVVLG